MLIDAQNEFSDAQAVTATAIGTNMLNLGSTDDYAIGEPLFVDFVVNTAFASGGAPTMIFQIVQDTENTGGSPSVLVASASHLKAALTVGVRVRLYLPANTQTQQYLGVQYTVGVTTYTAGKVDAFLSPVEQASETYTGEV
jgi:hypothetical protein